MAANVSITDLAATYRADFTVFNHVTYLNTCSQGALADSVKASMSQYLSTLELKGSAWGDWAGHQERVRGLLAQFFNVPATEIAVTTSASAGIASVASSLDFSGKRNKVVTTENEFPTIGQIWHAQEARGATVVHAPSNADNTVNLEALIKAIDEETLIVSITHVCFRNGTVTELEPIIEAAHRVGALVMVDAYQSVGAIPVDLSELKADFLVGGVLKYMIGLPGVGFLFAREETTKHLIPINTGWFAARDIFKMDIHSYDPATDARRFESGTPPIPALYPAAAGLEYVLNIGLDKIAAYVAPLHDALREGVEAMGGRVVTPAAPHLHGAMLAVASTDENSHVAALESEAVVTSCRDGNVRVSPHFYNDATDVERALAAFAKHKHLLRA